MPKIDDELKSRFESEQQKAYLNVMFTANWFRSQQTALFRPYDISPQQYNILRILRGAKGRLNMHSVKDRMIDRAPNATRRTDKLIAKGLVERERCEDDRRVVYVRISTKGLELMKVMDREQRNVMRSTFEKLTEDQARLLNEVLDAWRD